MSMFTSQNNNNMICKLLPLLISLISISNYGFSQQKFVINKECTIKYITFLTGKPQIGQAAEITLTKRCADIELGGSKFRLIIHDYNSNGSYADNGIDALQIVDYGLDTAANSSAAQIVRMKDSLSFICDSLEIAVNLFPNSGDYIVLSYKKSLQRVGQIAFNSKIPNVSLISPNSTNWVQLENLIEKGKYVFIDIWATWCSSCIEQHPVLAEISKSYPNLQVITLLYNNGNKATLTSFDAKYHDKWLNFMLPKDQEQEFFYNGLPYGLLYDPKGNLIKSQMRVKDIPKYVKK
jgi:thiol-disulfide isomerase/thioredoxin